MKRRTRVAAAVALVVLAFAGVWLYRNAYLPRLRAEFLPWMHRLEAWRDAIEEIERALKRREPGPGDPSGIAMLRQWAWSGLDRLAFVTYEVRRPTHEVGESRDVTSGIVYFTVGGFRKDGARVERSAAATVTIGAPPTARLTRVFTEEAERQPRFRNATADAGLGAVRRDPPQPGTNRLIAGIWPGSGVAVLDFDGDGDEDLFAGDGVRSILYENDGSGRFTDVTERTGLAGATGDGIAATGVAAADIDGDGKPDLFVTDSFGPARLFRNDRGGKFAEATASSGIRVAPNARSAAFSDIDGDGDLDLFVCVTGDYYRQMPDPPYDAEDGGRNLLFVNDGRGRFREASAEWGVTGPKRWSLSSLFGDFDGDGRPDLVVTNDFGLKNLYRNDGGRRFVDVTSKAGVPDRAYGMSAAWGDFDGDGRLDLYTTGCFTQWYFLHEYPGLPIPFPGRLFLSTAVSWMEKMTRGNSLFLQRSDGRFEDATEASGARRAGWNWSAVAADLDNDSRTDLYATNGMWGDGRDHDRELEFWWETLAYWNDYVGLKKTFDRKGAGIAGIERDRYYVNRGPSAAPDGPIFRDRAFLDGLDLETNGRAVVAFDANGDGALDLYVRSVQAPEALFLGSRGKDEHFLRIRLTGSTGKDNAQGVGARVVATLPGGRKILADNGNASGYLSTGSPVVHLGLGAATLLQDLTVRWPSGKTQALGPIDAVDRTVLVDSERGLVLP
ncbi:MAG TPA: CRTAC1 family protein [Thermoanaerobaculia bacterium]|nr:CRTAC1 family protein [Thermoanaerobaculia bacterium]